MPYEDTGSVSIPPEHHHHKRRGTDRVSWKRVSVGTVTLGAVLTVWQVISQTKPILDFYAGWKAVYENANRIPELEAKLAEHEHYEETLKRLEAENIALRGALDVLEKALDETGGDLERLKRWQCRLGWNPPTTRDPQKECG